MMGLFQESYSLEELSQMPLEDLADYLRVKGRNRFPDAKQGAKSIQKAAHSFYRLDKVVEDSIDAILGTSITLIRTFEKQIKELDKTILTELAPSWRLQQGNIEDTDYHYAIKMSHLL